MARIDAALMACSQLDLVQALGDEDLLGRTVANSHSGSGGCFSGGPIRSTAPAALHQRIGLELDLLAEAALARLGGNIDALAGHVVFPAVIGAAQAGLLVARTRATRRGGRRIRRSIRTCLRYRETQAAAPTGASRAPAGNRSPAAPRPAARAANRRENLAHRRAGPGLRQQVVLFFPQHRHRLIDLGTFPRPGFPLPERRSTLYQHRDFGPSSAAAPQQHSSLAFDGDQRSFHATSEEDRRERPPRPA